MTEPPAPSGSGHAGSGHAGSAPAGTIHDLGYKRYVGARQSTSTRWIVIMRHQIASAWKTWWRYKAALGLATIVTFIAGGVMFLLQDRAVKGVVLPNGIAATLTDAALPRAIEWYSRVAFLLSLTIGARLVAGDIQTGAFTFYFARSVRPRDYVLGKIAGLFLVVATIMLVGPLLLALARLALSDSTDELIAALPILPKALAIGLLGTLAYSAIPLGFSALIRDPRHALALWAAYYLIVGGIVWILARAMHNSIGAIDIATSIDAVTYDLFEMKLAWGRAKYTSTTAALISLFAHAGAGIAIVVYQVRRAHLAGIGGAS